MNVFEALQQSQPEDTLYSVVEPSIRILVSDGGAGFYNGSPLSFGVPMPVLLGEWVIKRMVEVTPDVLAAIEKNRK